MTLVRADNSGERMETADASESGGAGERMETTNAALYSSSGCFKKRDYTISAPMRLIAVFMKHSRVCWSVSILGSESYEQFTSDFTSICCDR